MERLLKRIAAFGLLTAYWLGVISEAVATCFATTVCSYPATLGADMAVLMFFSAMTFLSVRSFVNYRQA